MKTVNFTYDAWDIPSQQWNIKEDYLNEHTKSSVVDGKNILAVVEGIFFVPDGVSRNERFYPKKFWDSILSRNETIERIANKQMMGTIGHFDRNVSEEDIQEGRVSHIVTKLWVDEENRGMGQAYVLGTPAGRNLYVLMKAGCKIKTSSRASGDFKSDENYNGMPIVDENNYYLETFDFVINPGFLETNPSIKENVDKIKKQMEKDDMELEKKLFEYLEKDKDSLNEKLITVRESNAVLETKNGELNEKVSSLTEQVKELNQVKEDLQGKQKENETLTEEVKTLKEKLDKFSVIAEDADEAKKIIEESTVILEAYTKLGSPEKLEKVLKESEELISKYVKFGEVDDLKETLPVVEAVLSEYAKLGTLEEVKEIVSRATELTSQLAKEKFENLALSVSREYKAPIDNVKALLEKLGEKQTVDILKANLDATTKIIKEQKAPKATKENKIEEKVERKEVKTSQEKPLVAEIFRSLKRDFRK